MRAAVFSAVAAIGVTLSCTSSTEPGGGGGGDGNPSRELSTITAAPSSIVANGTSTATITVALRQPDGTAYTQSGGAVALTASSGTIGAVSDLNNGTYTATLTAPVTAGAAVISATLAGASLSDTAGITYVSGPPATIAIANASANAQTAVAGSVVPIPPSVKITDAHGNPVSGITVAFSVGSGGGSITGASPVTDLNGVATVGSWRLGPTPGPNTLIATVTLPSSLESAISAADLTVTFTATGSAGAATSIAINGGNNQSATVGSAVSPPPSVKATDANGNPVAGVAVTFAVASGGGSITGGSATTDASGIATVGSWTLGPTAGPNTLTATSSGLAGSPLTFTATATPREASNLAIFAGNNQTAVAGTSVTVAPAVKVTDINGDPISGVSITFAVASGGGSVTGGVATSDAGGVATVGSWTLGVAAGQNTLTVSFTSISGTPVTFVATGTAAVPAVLSVNGGDNQSALAGTAVATPPSVKVTDANGNPISGVAVTFAVTLGGGSITGANATTNASGIATVGSWTLGSTPGANRLTATSGALTPVVINATGTAAPPPAPVIAINGGNNQTATAGTAVTTAPSVKVTDTSNNPLAGVTVVFAVASGGGSITGATQTTNASGIATVGSWTLGPTAGPNTLTATSTGASGSPVTFSATGTATVVSPSIVFEMLKDGNYDIWRVNLDGSGLQQLTTHTAEEHHPSSAGGKVYFSSVRDGNSEIYRMDATGAPGSEVRVTNDTLWQTYVQISPNAQRLAFLQAPAGTPPKAYFAPADASNPQQLAPNFSSGSFEFDVAWSQSSDKVAFSSNESFPIAIYVATPGSTPTKPGFNSTSGNKFQPAWGPDGRIVYLRASSGSSTSDMILVDPATGASTMLLSGQISEPTWLPNNTIVYATYTPTSVYSLHWIDPANPGVVHDINTGGGSARFPSAIFP